MTELQKLQQGMPTDLKAQHDAMSYDAAWYEYQKLHAEALKCDYFGNTCSLRGPDHLALLADNFAQRARYFKLLAESKT